MLIKRLVAVRVGAGDLVVRKQHFSTSSVDEDIRGLFPVLGINLLLDLGQIPDF